MIDYILSEYVNMARSHVCPLMPRDPLRDDGVVVNGSGVAISIGEREFILTAAHVVDFYPEPYTMQGQDRPLCRVPVVKSGKHETSDLGYHEVERGFLRECATPLYSKSLGAKALEKITEFVVVGFPMSATRRIGRIIEFGSSIALADHPVRDDTDWEDGDNCVYYSGDAYTATYLRDNEERQRVQYSSDYKQGEDPTGFSGGGAFVFEKIDADALTLPSHVRLMGIQSAWGKRGILLIPAITDLLQLLIDDYPELSEELSLRIFDSSNGFEP